MARTRKKHKFLRFISTIIWLATMAALGYFTYILYEANVVPIKYFAIIGGVALFLLLVFLIFINNSRTKVWLFLFNDLLFLLIIGACYFGYVKLNDVMTFLKENLGAKYETNIYYFVVNKDSKYQKLEDIEGKTVKLVDDLDNKEELERNIKKKVNVSFEYLETIVDSLYDVEENTDLVLFVNSGNYDAMADNYDDFEEKVRTLDTVEIKFRMENTATGIDVTEDSFVVYLSGIDTRSGKMPAKSLSDVNILLVINPTDRKILMIHTPRDYFVQIGNSKGLKDKLTHAGLTGGIKTSLATMENLYDIKIPYYARVNFNAAIKLVDAVGGITIYSDKKTTFTCWTDRSCKIKPGNNDVKGKCALAFARERHAYKEGDRHRGENQEQVITKLIEKITSSKTLLTKSSDILKSLEGTFETNITTEEITSLVKMQLDDMKSWTIETYNVSGTDSYEYTRSYPNQQLYVMVPDYKTVNTAKEKMAEALK